MVLTKRNIRTIQQAEIKLLLLGPIAPAPHVEQAGQGSEEGLDGPNEEV